jgi:hypothetical protein
VRDFGIAVDRFDIATATARAPGPVRITAAVDRSVEGLPMDVARRAKAALEAISARYGPYPWPTLHLVVVPALGRVGIEYPTMIFLGPQSVARATTHEVAHQWFYSLMGNDRARDPVLDEGLATYVQAQLDHIWPYLDGLPDPEAARHEAGRTTAYWQGRPRNLYALAVYADDPRMVRALGHP